MNLVLCERYSTKMTAGACEKFRANTPERCAKCDGPMVDAVLDEPVVLSAVPVHAKPKGRPGDYINMFPKGGKPKQEDDVTSKKKTAPCASCGEEKPITGRGLCGKCWSRERAQGTIDINFPSTHGLTKKITESTKTEDDCTTIIKLPFVGKDRQLFEVILRDAKRNRRSIDQEILFRLEQGGHAA